MQNGHYSSQKERLLYDFDRSAQLVSGIVADRYGDESADRIFRDARQAYETIIPQIPYIEGARARPLNAFLRITAQEVAVYKAMKKHGKTSGEAWEICHEAIRLRMEKFPRWKVWLFRRLMYSPMVKRRIRRRADKKEQLRFGDFEVRYVIGDGHDFDWGVDYVGCGNLELVKKLGAEEFAPYVCMSDIPLGTRLGWDLARTQTLADGCDQCDFRFKKGAGMHITSKTPEVQQTIDRIRGVSRV
ncbi:MAG: L-2-amino-thiazoline-4-carboxylic acid hydrolase [Candidatus Krumholzibacteria bacterium]|nr:L-2-amino-thiazoline-4-carboxylic acid hydrolase [Candidatus Krumholzibacteria bacterium]